MCIGEQPVSTEVADDTAVRRVQPHLITSGHHRRVVLRETMPVANAWIVAGSSSERQAWGNAFAELSAADREAALEVGDLERLAVGTSSGIRSDRPPR